MNERIKEIVDAVNIPHQVGDNCRMVSDQELEKFAELIVRECAKEAAYWWPADYYGAKAVEDRILQHFGVE